MGLNVTNRKRLDMIEHSVIDLWIHYLLCGNCYVLWKQVYLLKELKQKLWWFIKNCKSMQYLWWSVDWKNLMVANLKIPGGTVSISTPAWRVMLSYLRPSSLRFWAVPSTVSWDSHVQRAKALVRLNYLTVPVSLQTTHFLGLIFTHLVLWFFTCFIYVDHTWLYSVMWSLHG